MLARILPIALCLALLTAPGALAHDGSSQSDADPLGTCGGTIDFACTHVDCNHLYCIILFCPVYVGHSGHIGILSGCTPP